MCTYCVVLCISTDEFTIALNFTPKYTIFFIFFAFSDFLGLYFMHFSYIIILNRFLIKYSQNKRKNVHLKVKSMKNMKKEYNNPYSFIDGNIICEHKFARTEIYTTPTLHNHNGYEMLLFLAGDVTMYVESDAKKLERGDLMLISPYTFHGTMLTDLPSYERVTINIREDYFPSICDKHTDLAECFTSRPANKLNFIKLDEDAIATCNEICAKLERTIAEKGYAHRLMQKAYLTELMVFINTHMSNHESPEYHNILPPLVTDIYQIVEDNLAKDCTVEFIAKELHHNSDYLNRLFKQYSGNSLKHYITAKKISLAQWYMAQGLSPYDVCFLVGYNNYSTFSRAFNERVGMSPKKYQILNR